MSQNRAALQRGAVVVYAGFALATLPLHLSIPRGRFGETTEDLSLESRGPRAVSRSDRLIAGGLYALIATMASILNSGMSAHMIGILSGLGLAAAASVWISALRGVGQSLSRLAEVLFGRKFDPIALNLGAALLLPIGFAVGLFSNEYASAALFFAFCYGAGNGILTITRGTLPLVLFDHRTYGTVVGRLLAPELLAVGGRAARLCHRHRAFWSGRSPLSFDRAFDCDLPSCRGSFYKISFGAFRK